MQHIPRKRFGQHFLVDSSTIDAIIQAIAPHQSDHLIEIGPGMGAITQPLLECVEKLHVIELDRDLAAQLASDSRLLVTQADVLKVDFSKIRHHASKKMRLVGNLPYNISTPILFHLLPFASEIMDQHFMLQKEVVDRMVADPCSKSYGRLSVMLQWRYHMESVLDVAPDAFDPPPRIQSSVVRMIPWPDATPLNFSLLEELVQTAFSQRRKILRHTLGPWLDEHAYPEAFDLQRRAEEVPAHEFVQVAQRLTQASTSHTSQNSL